MIDNLIGRLASEVANEIEKAGYIIRVVSIDEKVYHADLNSCCIKKRKSNKRINLRIKNGIVVEAFIG